MRINPDCIRQILLAVEAETGMEYAFCLDVPCEDDDPPAQLGRIGIPHSDEASLGYSEEYQKLISEYSINEILYHLRQCDLSGLFLEYRRLSDEIYIRDLMPAGHELLAKIRGSGLWEKTKEIISKAGSFSIGAIAQVASIVFQEYITSQLPPH